MAPDSSAGYVEPPSSTKRFRVREAAGGTLDQYVIDSERGELLAKLNSDMLVLAAELVAIRAAVEDLAADDELSSREATVQGILGRLVADSEFSHVLNLRPLPGEEMRRDEGPMDDFIGSAPDSTPTGTATWRVVRLRKELGMVVRVQFRSAISWDGRTGADWGP